MCHHFSSKIPFGQMERGICAKLTLPQKSSSKARREKRKITKNSCTEDIPLKNSSWSKMLAKVFQIDVTQCHHCKGDMAILAAIINHSEVARYFKHLGIEHEAGARAPPRYQEESYEFGSEQNRYETTATPTD